MWQPISEHISQATGKPFVIEKTRPVSGGCINQGYALQGRDRTYFVKLNKASGVEMFQAEALGLKQMWATNTIRVPEPVVWGASGTNSYLVLEWLEFGGGQSSAWAEMGRRLARLHRVREEKRFGWEQNNTIGSTPQINTWENNWADFFARHRIGYQLKLARRKGGNFGDENEVTARVKSLLKNHQPQPSLVHGDLWSGNAGILENGEPVILDPAVYYGDREVDIAMTELFGGFSGSFYQGYNEVYPLDSGYSQRKTLYNLYHILNHFNLFGGGYASGVERMLRELDL
ncbi:MAG: putative ketoamine kinase [Chroococcopsis gigantea SAG 12.99]|jgi:fructosamine-3-kinase|nr:putative ketoamine kinase [Chroococcopsis gigantea SAG 12.99]